ncbi:MAG: threonylcarbamoyl-AMP synthase [Thermoprotei archaeon]|nr:MAG: threonylcarbamoyl-AMP synthase [Thermoprotei archaeon]
MRLLKVNTVDDIRRVATLIKDIVKSGGLIIYPTDTVYGLGADPFNVDAVKKVFHVKRRQSKPLPVLASRLEHIFKICDFDERALTLAEAFWPGPLTIVVKKKETLPSIVTAGRNTVGVRIPNHEIAREIIEICGGLLIGTSANISGHSPPKSAEEAIRELGSLVDIVIDSGSAPLGIPSTIVDLTVDPPIIRREGIIKAKDVLRVLRK